jgi:hypothetical protein
MKGGKKCFSELKKEEIHPGVDEKNSEIIFSIW